MAFGKSHRDPYATSVGHLIEKATFAGVQTEDWGQFMHICDVINTANDGPKDAVKALKKRISKNYNHKEIELTLSLIDMCMQNCGPSFQSLIVKKEFIKDSLVKLLNPKYNLPLNVQNRILNFIKTWSQGFPGGVDASEVKEVYLDLLKKGVHFPASDAEAETAERETTPPTCVPTAPALSSVIAPKNTTISLVPEQIGKLLSELDMVKMNVEVMSAILIENIPGSENREDIELLQSFRLRVALNSKETWVVNQHQNTTQGQFQLNGFWQQINFVAQPVDYKLYKTCREMQERIMDLLVVVENEDVTVELIQVNEDLNNAILGYERFVRNQQRILEQNNQRENANTASEPSAPSCELVDLSPSPPNDRASLEELNAMNAQLSDLSFSSPGPLVTNNLQPSLHPLVDFLALGNTETALSAQRTSQNLASDHTYESFPDYANATLLHPVSLQTAPATPSNQRRPALPGSHPAVTKNDLQPPSYYEVMEFDPLAPAVTTEATYEEIDAGYHKGTQNHSDC